MPAGSRQNCCQMPRRRGRTARVNVMNFTSAAGLALNPDAAARDCIAVISTASACSRLHNPLDGNESCSLLAHQIPEVSGLAVSNVSKKCRPHLAESEVFGEDPGKHTR